MNEYHIDIRTDIDMGSEVFVRNLLTDWCVGLDNRLTPEFYGLGEPVRHKLIVESIDDAVHSWVSTGMSLMLRRKSKPKYIASIDWHRREKCLDKRPFPWSCTIWLSLIAGDSLAVEILRFLIRHFDPSFGHITTTDSLYEKHFITYKDRIGQVEEYVGLDVENVFPGIYWVTYFGSWAVAKIGKARFASLRAYGVEPLGDGYLIFSHQSNKDAMSLPAREAEQMIIGHLGKPHFFDKSQVDVKSNLTNAETAVEIEKVVEQFKKKRR